MLGNLHVRFGVGVGVKLHGLHHARRRDGSAKADGFTPHANENKPEPYQPESRDGTGTAVDLPHGWVFGSCL